MLLFFSEKDDEKLRHAWKTMWSLLKNDQGDNQLLPRYLGFSVTRFDYTGA